MRGRLIVVEGLDGSGKTSAIRALEETVAVTVLKGSGSATLLGRLARATGSTMLFFLENWWVGTRYAQSALARGETVVLDRYWWSPATFRAPRRCERVLIATMPHPDAIAYFTVECEERLRRLARNTENPYHRLLLEHPWMIAEREARYDALFSSYGGRKARIDTTEVSIFAAARSLAALVRSMRRAGRRPTA